MGTSVPAVPTVGEIARRTGYAVHRVEYLIRSRNIQPSGWAGAYRIFTEADVERIATELRSIDTERASAEPQLMGPTTRRIVSEATGRRDISGGNTQPEGGIRE